MFGEQWKYNNQKGFTMVEIIVVVAVILSVFTVILGFFTLEAKIAERTRMRLKALLLAEETMEAVRNFRDNTTWSTTGISTFLIGNDYHPASTSLGWDIISGNEDINGFNRKIVFNRVYRDTNANISSSGTEDQNSRKITITVSWQDRLGATSEILSTYLTNWRQ